MYYTMTIEGKEKFVRDEAIKKDGGGAIETNTILDKVGSETPDWLVNIEAKIGEMNTGYQEQFNADVEKIFRTFLSTQTEKFSGTDIMQQIETKFKAWAEANKNKKIPGLQFNETDLLSYISECVSLEVNKEQEINALIKTTEQEINTLIEDTKQKVENIKEEILKESDIR